MFVFFLNLKHFFRIASGSTLLRQTIVLTYLKQFAYQNPWHEWHSVVQKLRAYHKLP